MLARNVNRLISWKWARRISAIGVGGLGVYAAGWFVAGVGIQIGLEIMGALR